MRNRGSTTGGDHSRDIKRQKSKYKHRDDTRAVRLWLENEVKLPRYYDTFIAAGYESMEIVIEIDHVNDLTEIGIKLPGHQKKILAEIRKLQNVRNNEIDARMIPHQGSIALEYGGYRHNDEYERKLSHVQTTETRGMNEVQLEGDKVIEPDNDEEIENGSQHSDANSDNGNLEEVQTRGNFEQNLGDNQIGK